MLLVNPHATPVYSVLKKGKKPRGFIHAWPARTVPIADATAIADGTDVSSSDAGDVESLKQLLYNRPHQLQRVAFTGNLTQELEHQYGITDIHADTVMQFMEALKWDTESVLVGNQESAISGQTHTTRGITAWLGLASTARAPYTTYTIDTGCPIHSSLRASTSGGMINVGNVAASAVTEANLRDMMEGLFTATYRNVDNLLGVCTPTMKSTITNFAISGSTASNTHPLRRWDGQASNTVGANITRVVGDFGSIDLVPHVALPTTAATLECSPYLLALSLDCWELLPVTPLSMKAMPDLGGGPRTLLRTAFTLKCAAPLRNGCIYETNA